MAKGFSGFVILADMRTGSNALEERLNDFAGIQSHGEVFNPHFIGKPNCEELFGITLKQRDLDPTALLTALRENTEGLAGFRLFSDHDPRVAEAVLADRETAKIVLTRNVLDSYVSLKIARETGQWWLSDLKARRAARIRFDPAEFEAYAAERARHLVRIRHRLQVTGQTLFEIGYADLGDEDVIAGCARFLGARERREKATRKGRAQNPVPIAEKVSNVAEMKAFLAAWEPFDTDRLPDFEPSRGPNVPSFRASATQPILYMPIRCAADRECIGWLAAIDGTVAEGLVSGLSQKALRSWKRRHRAHRSFTVVSHPLQRAHEAFCRFILPVGPGSFPGIRKTLRRSYRVELPDDPADPGYDAAAHQAAFLGFLRFLKGNLAGQTAVRVDAAWASQAACIQGLADFNLPDAICRAETLGRDLAAVAAQVGVSAPEPPMVDDGAPYALDEIYSDKIEAAARSAYQRDYMMFGYGPWRAG